MATKTTTKTAARKPATARKAVKAAVAVEPKRKEAKSVKELPAKTSRISAPASTKTRAAHSPPAPKAHAEPAPKPAEAPKPAKPAMETVSLIEEKKPRLKRADGDGARKTSFLPPISRIRATPEPPTTPIAPVVPPKAEPIAAAPAKEAAAPAAAIFRIVVATPFTSSSVSVNQARFSFRNSGGTVPVSS